MTKKIMGCDPGVAGAIVVLDESGKIIGAHAMPTFDVLKPKKETAKTRAAKKASSHTKSKNIDFRALFDLMGNYFKGEHPEIYVEEITHLFGLPSSSNFKLGYAFGVLQSVVQTYSEEHFLVNPRKWQGMVFDEADKVFKPNKRIDPKETAKKAFSRIFPDYNGPLNEGIRDAALIAHYGLTGGL